MVCASVCVESERACACVREREKERERPESLSQLDQREVLIIPKSSHFLGFPKFLMKKIVVEVDEIKWMYTA